MEDTPEVLTGWVENWSLLSQSWRVALVVFGLVFATATVAFIVSRVILYLEHRFERSENIWDDTFLHALRRPAIGFVWLQGVYWAAEVAHKYSQADIFSVNDVLLELGFIWIIVWTLFGAIKQGESVLASPMRMKRPMDYTTVNAISKLLRAVVAITALLTVLQSLGYSISGVLAFGGVGGIAVGFAAKDLLANFFGGFIIHLDRPFKVGDWVRSPDRNIEGTVEKIGWRLTTVRTFDKRPLYVPNAAFTQISVENPSRMTNRRIHETIGIRYVDVGEMSSIVSEIREMLKNHEEIDANQTLIVNFLAFNSSSLDIMVYTFTKTVEWVKFHEVKQDVLLKISDIIESYGAEVAFPTRTLHVAESVRVESRQSDNDERVPDDGEKSRSSMSGHGQTSQSADSGPVREPSGPGQHTTRGDEGESQ
ncbi:MscS family membrane protein [Marinobacter daqiaonensis]|uniref:MscS family membrane protein n=1 Tax=Marinobacter daqiaonensis TaxID=650891 RepID=A0A1I6H571_9GAMM|nr:mechanosensitive ion channel family protein [Marinobacter daqiaonensis]SFR49540.1 MscS family membrane protein [Marinobacter daqiaonensis]